MQARSTVSISDTVQIHSSNPITVVAQSVRSRQTLAANGQPKQESTHRAHSPAQRSSTRHSLRQLVDREQVAEDDNRSHTRRYNPRKQVPYADTHVRFYTDD